MAAAAVVIATLIDRDLRGPDGFPTARICMPISAAIALGIIAATVRSRLRVAGAWAALAVLGQAAALQLIVAGPFVRYQHIGPVVGSLTPYWLPIGLVVAQAMAVVAASRRSWRAAAVRVRDRVQPFTFAVLALFFVCAAVPLSRGPATFGLEVLVAGSIQLITLANIILIVRALPRDIRERIALGVERWLPADGSEVRPRGLDRGVLLAAGWATLAAALLSLLIYQRHPHVPDEVSYLWQARYFARGWLAMPLPAVPEAFNLDLMTYEATRWYSPFPPGWPVALAAGIAVGAPWLVNPVLTGISLLLAFLFLQELYPLRTARLAVVLLAVSPWLLFMGMSFMAHTFTLTVALAAAVCVARGRRTGRLHWAWLGGLACGIVSLARPLDGLLVACLLGTWWLTARPLRRGLAGGLSFAAAAVAMGALALPYNRQLTGNAGRHPVMDYFDRTYGAGVNDLGFGSNRGVGWTGLDPFPGHDLIDVAVNAQLNTAQINIELLGWGTGSLILLMILLANLRRLRTSDLVMLTAAAGVVVVQSLYWFGGGPDFGARYWYLMIVPCGALSARGIEVLLTAPASPSPLEPTARGSVFAAVGVLSLLALLLFMPWRALDKYHHYRSMRPDIRALAQEHRFARDLVLIRGRRHPDYASAAIYNPLDWSAAAPIYAWDRGDEVRRRLMRAYPDRRVWIVNGPSVTGAGYHIVAGPLPRQGVDP